MSFTSSRADVCAALCESGVDSQIINGVFGGRNLQKPCNLTATGSNFQNYLWVIQESRMNVFAFCLRLVLNSLIFTLSPSSFYFNSFTFILSPFNIHHLTSTLSPSLLYFHSFTFTLSLPLIHVHPVAFTPPLSHFTFILSPSPFYFQSFAFTSSLLPFHLHSFTFTPFTI